MATRTVIVARGRGRGHGGLVAGVVRLVPLAARKVSGAGAGSGQTPTVVEAYPAIGPGCVTSGDNQSVTNTPGDWWPVPDGDYVSPLGNCNGLTMWAWTETDAAMYYQEQYDPTLAPGDQVDVELWTPWDHAGAYAARYEYFAIEDNGNAVSLGPATDINQNLYGTRDGNNWYTSGGPYTLQPITDGGHCYTNIMVKETDDSARDVPDRELGAGDVLVSVAEPEQPPPTPGPFDPFQSLCQ